MTGIVAWLTGLPSSGKSTLARETAEQLRARGRAVVVLDGDAVRAALRPPPGYDDASRANFYASLASLASLVARQGLVVLVPATANRAAYREAARAIAPRFFEVHVATPLEVCVARDAKGLYARAARDARSTMPGGGAIYEAPANPDFVAHGGDADALAVAIERALTA